MFDLGGFSAKNVKVRERKKLGMSGKWRKLGHIHFFHTSFYGAKMQGPLKNDNYAI